MRARVVGLVLATSLATACGGGAVGPPPAPGSDPGPAHATSAGGSGTERLPDVAAFADASRILVGAFSDPITLGAGEANETTLTPLASDDTFLARYGADGLVTWVKQIEGTGTTRPAGVSAVPDGSCIVAGQYSGTVTLGKGEGNQTTFIAAGGSDTFVARFGPDGTLAWAKRVPGPAAVISSGVSAFADGSSVVSGRFSNTALFGPGEGNQTLLTAVGNTDVFVARYNPGGTLAWAKQTNSTTSAFGEAVSAVPDGSCVVAGHYTGNTVFGPGEGNQTTLPAGGSADVFMARYNPNGTLAWAKQAGGATYDTPYDVAAFPDGSSVVVGESDGAMVFGPGEANQTTIPDGPGVYTPFFARYAPNGALQWAKSATGAEYHEPYGVAALDDGSCVAAGNFRPDITLGVGEPGETTLTTVGDYDIFVARLAMDGALIWARSAGGPEYDTALQVAPLPGAGCLVTGTYRATAVFGPGEVHQTSLTAVGSPDLYVAHYGPNGDI